MTNWFSSDFHFNHTNIAGPDVSNWKSGYRDFTGRGAVEEMNETIIKNINKYVQWDDTLYFDGDWCFGGHKLTPHWRNRLNVQTIHLIRGNHDKHIDRYKNSFTSIQDYLEVELNGRWFVLSHYAFRVWIGSHKGYFHCYGHSHDNLEHSPNGKSMDVGIDAAKRIFGEYRPFSEAEVVSILDKREIQFIDHHAKSTNIR